jgi:predicted transcriptional regulator
MKVSDVMTRTPAFCTPETNLGSAVEVLWNRNCGILQVVNSDQQVISVITDRDICVQSGEYEHESRGEVHDRRVCESGMFDALRL